MRRFSPILLLSTVLAALSSRAAEPRIRYVDATTLTVIGKALDTESPYNRIDTARHRVPERTEEYCCHATGLAVVFRTDSPIIRARWLTSGKMAGTNMTAIAQKGLDLYIRRNGKWVFAGVGNPKTGSDRHDATIVQAMEAGEKECLLYLPLFDRVNRLEIGVAEGCRIEAMTNPFRHRIVVHGSSITHGASAGRAGMAYPALLQRSTGLHTINLGFSGRCTLQPEFAAFLAGVQADAFLFDCFSNPNAQTIEERFDRFVDTIRRTHPATPLIFLQTLVRETGNFDREKRLLEDRKRATAQAQVRKRMKRDEHLYFIDPGNLLGSDHNATVDGIHPSDLGFERMLERIEPQIRKILEKYGIR